MLGGQPSASCADTLTFPASREIHGAGGKETGRLVESRSQRLGTSGGRRRRHSHHIRRNHEPTRTRAHGRTSRDHPGRVLAPPQGLGDLRGGRALQKFLVALLLPLYAAFLTAATTASSAWSCCRHDLPGHVRHSRLRRRLLRFYFDDKTQETRAQGHHQRLLRVHRLPTALPRRARGLHAADRAVAAGQNSTAPATRSTSTWRWQRCSSATSTTCRSRCSVWNAGPRVSAPTPSGASSSRCPLRGVRRGLRLGPWACCSPTSSRPPACKPRSCQRTSAPSTGACTSVS